MSNRLLNEAEAAERLGWSKRTLQRRRWQRLPPSFIKIGRSVRYDPAAIDAFIAHGAHEPNDWQQVSEVAARVMARLPRGEQ
jgi:predicted DNA-binding transcriptional regulator AlpA